MKITAHQSSQDEEIQAFEIMGCVAGCVEKGKIILSHSAATLVFLLFILLTSSIPASAWYDETHLAIAKAAGYAKYYNAAGADMIKEKAKRTESQNHWFDNNAGVVIDPNLVMKQAERYDTPDDPEGHLYGAIIGALKKFFSLKAEGKYAEYHLAFAAHYIGDLSNPLHNSPDDKFNRNRHSENDGIIEAETLNNFSAIQNHMTEVKLDCQHWETGVSNEVARIANLSNALGLRMRAEDRNMTKEEAYIHAGLSASLLKAVISCIR